MMRWPILVVPAFIASVALAGTHEVSVGSSLQRALDLAARHDTLILNAGNYSEGTIHINKPVTLLGRGWPVVDGGGRGEVIVVKADSVRISGIEVRGTAISNLNDNAAIKCIDGRHIELVNNRASDTFFGIYLSGVADARIMNNRVIGDPATAENRRANGIHAWKCTNIEIAYNTVRNHRDGIYLEFVTDSQVHHDSSSFNLRYGLHFMFSHRDGYSHNVFHDNGAGVAVMFTHHVTMTNNRFEDNRGASAYGLLLKEINDATITDNEFHDNTVGLLVDGCNRAVVEGNHFRSNGWAIKLYANSEATITGNAFSGNTFDMSTNGELMMSKLQGNYWDRYRGYDLDHDGVGDVPHRPLSMFGLVAERMPYAMVLSRSLLVNLLDQSERVVPTLTPETLQDPEPLMKPPHG